MIQPTQTPRITTVTEWRTFEDSEDENGAYTGGTRSTIRIDTHDSIDALYAHVRQVAEHAADMGDGSSAKLLCAFWTGSGEPLSVEMLSHEAHAERDA